MVLYYGEVEVSPARFVVLTFVVSYYKLTKHEMVEIAVQFLVVEIVVVEIVAAWECCWTNVGDVALLFPDAYKF